MDPTTIANATNWIAQNCESTCSTESPTDAAPTPPESIAAPEQPDSKPNTPKPKLSINTLQPKPPYSVPWPGSTYTLTALSTNSLLTLLNGTIVLKPSGSNLGSIHWICESRGGWLGFRNPVSNRYLGFTKGDKLVCISEKHLVWESFCVRMTQDGKGFVLLMGNGEKVDKLWPVGLVEGGLAKVNKGVEKGVVWGFGRVE